MSGVGFADRYRVLIWKGCLHRGQSRPIHVPQVQSGKGPDAEGSPLQKRRKLDSSSVTMNGTAMEEDINKGRRSRSPSFEIVDTAAEKPRDSVPTDIPPLQDPLPETATDEALKNAFQPEPSSVEAETAPNLDPPATTEETPAEQPKSSRAKKSNPPIINPRHEWEAQFASEAPDIKGLLMAHRARTPVAIIISEDYGVPPWFVPQPYVGLGWFWITDAWVEPVGREWTARNANGNADDIHLDGASAQLDKDVADKKRKRPTEAASKQLNVRWRFRFDWCTEVGPGDPRYPWWEYRDKTHIRVYEARAGAKVSEPDGWAIKGVEVNKSESVWLRKSDGTYGSDVTRESGRATIQGEVEWILCRSCGAASLAVYAEKRYCLNEVCPQFFCEPDNQRKRDAVIRVFAMS